MKTGAQEIRFILLQHAYNDREKGWLSAEDIAGDLVPEVVKAKELLHNLSRLVAFGLLEEQKEVRVYRSRYLRNRETREEIVTYRITSKGEDYAIGEQVNLQSCPELADILKKLSGRVKLLTDSLEKDDILAIAKALDEECRRDKPRRAVVAALLSALSRNPHLEASTAAIARAFRLNPA